MTIIKEVNQQEQIILNKICHPELVSGSHEVLSLSVHNGMKSENATWRSAFTLVETIMTLFVIGVVITASIMVFTGKHNATAVNAGGGAWQPCANGQFSGLCTTTPVIINPGNVGNIDTNKTFKTLDNNGNLIDPDPYYNLILGLNNANTLKDYFRSENASIKVGQHAIRVDNAIVNIGGTDTTVNNFYIFSNRTGANWNSPNLPSATLTDTYHSNVVIGNNIFSGDNNNVIIGANNNVTAGGSSNTILGYGNIVGGASGNFIFGYNNSTPNPPSNNNNLIIGFHTQAKNNSDGNNLLIRMRSSNNAPVDSNIEIGMGDAANRLLYADVNGGKYNITFNDDVTINGQVIGTATIQNPSDIRLKDIKSDYKKGLDEVLKINPVNYYYKSDTTATLHVGVIAQDLQKVFPEAVVKMPNGYLGVDNGPIFFATINALNQVNKKAIEEEQRTHNLEYELKKLEQEINELSICKSDSLLSKFRCWWMRIWQKITGGIYA